MTRARYFDTDWSYGGRGEWQEGIGDEAVVGIIRRQIESGGDGDKIAKLEQVGLVEITSKKGHFLRAIVCGEKHKKLWQLVH